MDYNVFNPHDVFGTFYLGDHCNVFENFMPSIGDLMVAN